MTYQRAQAAIAAADSIIVTTHLNPDGDGIGACLALLLALRAAGKRVGFCCPSPVAGIYAFLPGFDQLEVVDDEAQAKRRRPCDLLIACDCGDVARLGACAQLRRGQLLNLDHHASNDAFGDINVVDLKAAATGVVVDKVLRRLKLPMSPDIATCLYTTILFDTGRFMHGNTTSAVFRFAARLLDSGIDCAAINRALTYTKRPIDLAVSALGLRRLAIDGEESRLAGIALSRRDIAGLGDDVDDWGDLVDLPRSLAGIEAAYLIREQDDGKAVRVSLRSNPPWSVGEVAQSFGGGGHHQAAGCTVPGSLRQVQPELLRRLRAMFTAPAPAKRGGVSGR